MSSPISILKRSGLTLGLSLLILPVGLTNLGFAEDAPPGVNNAIYQNTQKKHHEHLSQARKFCNMQLSRARFSGAEAIEAAENRCEEYIEQLSESEKEWLNELEDPREEIGEISGMSVDDRLDSQLKSNSSDFEWLEDQYEAIFDHEAELIEEARR